MQGSRLGAVYRGEVGNWTSKAILRECHVLMVDYPVKISVFGNLLTSLKTAIHRIDSQQDTLTADMRLGKVYRSLDDFVWDNYNSLDQLYPGLTVLARLQGLVYREQIADINLLQDQHKGLGSGWEYPVAPASKGLSVFAAHQGISRSAAEEQDWEELRQELARRQSGSSEIGQSSRPQTNLVAAVWRGMKRKSARSLLSKQPLHSALYMMKPRVLDIRHTIDLLEGLLLSSHDIYGSHSELWNSAMVVHLLKHLGQLLQQELALEVSSQGNLNLDSLPDLQRLAKLVAAHSILNKLCPEEFQLLAGISKVN